MTKHDPSGSTSPNPSIPGPPPLSEHEKQVFGAPGYERPPNVAKVKVGEEIMVSTRGTVVESGPLFCMISLTELFQQSRIREPAFIHFPTAEIRSTPVSNTAEGAAQVMQAREEEGKTKA